MILVIVRIVSKIMRLFSSIINSIHICTMCVEIYTKEPPFSCRVMYLWYIVILIHLPVKEIFHFNCGLMGNVMRFFILPTAGYDSLPLFLDVSSICLLKKTVSKMCLFKKDNITMLYLISPKRSL